jgi:hypothetical protein
MSNFKPYTQTDVVSFYKELVKRWADDQLDQLADYPITKRKQVLVDLVQSNLEVFREDILEEIKSRKLSYLVD